MNLQIPQQNRICDVVTAFPGSPHPSGAAVGALAKDDRRVADEALLVAAL